MGLTLLLKNHFDTDRWMLLKHVYRVGRAAKHQSNTDMENYKNRPLNKHISITAISYNNEATYLSDRSQPRTDL